MTPTHAVAHYAVSALDQAICGNGRAIRLTADPTLVTCKHCRKAITRKIAQLLDQVMTRRVRT